MKKPNGVKFSLIKGQMSACRHPQHTGVTDGRVETPLNLNNFLQEVNLIAILEFLNFCSGCRRELKRLSGRGPFDPIRAFGLSFHISQKDLSAWRVCYKAS